MRYVIPIFFLLVVSCAPPRGDAKGTKHIVVFDTDANNELDDQHAMAYLILSNDSFDLRGVTVNATRGGGNIDEQYAEAVRVARLCNAGNLAIFKGANAGFDSIRNRTTLPKFDGSEAVDFIIREASKGGSEKVILLAVGKLTNVALVLKKAPEMQDKLRIVWLGSNYPYPGEYNLDNDTASVSYVLNSHVDMEIVPVRYGKRGGSDEVRLTQAQVREKMPGLGPIIKTPVEGRHGGLFTNFGDYSVNLFEHIHYNSDPPSRALYDLVAVAVVKNPLWGTSVVIPAPALKAGQWVDQPDNLRTITLWTDFNRENILADFFATLKP